MRSASSWSEEQGPPSRVGSSEDSRVDASWEEREEEGFNTCACTLQL